MISYITWFLCGILGLAFNVLVKLKALKARSQVANVKFSALSYFQDDYITLLLSVVAIIISLFCVRSAVIYKPELESYLNAIFIAIGYMGTSLITAFLSKAEDRINTIIDKKTDIADGIKP